MDEALEEVGKTVDDVDEVGASLGERMAGTPP